MEKESNKSLYSLKDSYIIAYLAFLNFQEFRRAQKQELISKQFIERIMLAVTEVNKCEACSYAHTKMALESGLSNEEIQNILAGIKDEVPLDEMPAIMFAQHYADYKGRPSTESWERITNIYGLAKAQGILGAIRIIMMGNTYAIPWCSFFNRFKGKPDSRSNLPYELSMILCSFLFIPLALVHALFAKIFKVSLIKF